MRAAHHNSIDPTFQHGVQSFFEDAPRFRRIKFAFLYLPHQSRASILQDGYPVRKAFNDGCIECTLEGGRGRQHPYHTCLGGLGCWFDRWFHTYK